METQTLVIGSTLRLANGRRFEIGDAPNGGRHVFQGPVDPNPFCFAFGLAAIVCADPAMRARLAMEREMDVTVKTGDLVNIVGYGLHRVRVVRAEWLELDYVSVFEGVN